MYLRLLTVNPFSRIIWRRTHSKQSAQIRLHSSDYEGFIVHPETQEPMDVNSFCANYVEPLSKEAGKVIFLSLAFFFNLFYR